jgi:nitrilase
VNFASTSSSTLLACQVAVPSIRCAGELYGDSIFCLPWMDDQQAVVRFSAHDEDFKYLKIERSKIESAREKYTFLEDRLTDYRRR